jgi:hypothetical protein
MNDENNKELSPCIVSWAKYALKIKSVKPNNNKKCSLVYWRKVIERLLEIYKENEKYRIEALSRYDFYVKK